MDKITITAPDGYALSALFGHPKKNGRSTIVISAATGVRKEFYINFARFLMENGYHVLLYDYRGIGESAADDIKTSPIYMHEWGTKDMNAVLNYLVERGFIGIIWLGHSIGIEQIPDVIISDVMMPGMNGLEFMDRIRQDERTCHIPILLLTAKADSESRMDGLKRGADEYLQKPFSMEELRVRVKNLREQRRRLSAKLKQELEQITERSPLSPVTSEPSLDEKFIFKVKSIIEENIGNSLFSVELLAESMNLSRAQLFRKVKALINTSPSEFINDLRMERAAQLIRAKADNVAQIGYAVGFSEQSYFAKRFRKKYGVSPSEFAHS